MTKLRLLAVGALVSTLVALALLAAIGVERALSPANLALTAETFKLVQRDYIRPISQDQLVTDALKGMLARLDPHSDYLDEQEFKEIRETINGKFGGLV
jgi:carboxyl-terminal processing protease